jgi:hypothetical protein
MSQSKVEDMGFDLRPDLLMDVAGDPCLLVRLRVEDDNQTIVPLGLVRTQQLYMMEAGLGGDGGAEALDEGVFESLRLAGLKVEIDLKTEHGRVYHLSLKVSIAVPPMT